MFINAHNEHCWRNKCCGFGFCCCGSFGVLLKKQGLCLFFVFCGCSFCMAWLIVNTCTYGSTTLHSWCVVLFMDISVEGARSSHWLWRLSVILCQWDCISLTVETVSDVFSKVFVGSVVHGFVVWVVVALAGTGSWVQDSETQLSTAQWNTAVNSRVKHSCQQHSETQL